MAFSGHIDQVRPTLVHFRADMSKSFEKSKSQEKNFWWKKKAFFVVVLLADFHPVQASAPLCKLISNPFLWGVNKKYPSFGIQEQNFFFFLGSRK